MVKMSKDSGLNECLPESESVEGGRRSPDISESQIETGDTPKKKRHVIKAKNMRSSVVDGTIKNSPLAKSFGIIGRLSKRNKGKSKKAILPSKDDDDDGKQNKLAQEFEIKEDDALVKKVEQKNESKNLAQNNSSAAEEEVSASLSDDNVKSVAETEKKTLKGKTTGKKNDKDKPTKKRSTKVSVKSHVLTDYYPVRRSSRKPKSLLEKEQSDFIVQAIQSKREDGLAVVEFKDKGRGVVAKRAFKKGSFVVEYSGDLVDWTEAKRREQEYAKDTSVGCYMYYFVFDNTNYCVDATVESGRLGRLLNHSRKNPNCKTKLIPMANPEGKGTLPRLIINAKRDISAGEELTYDYGDRDKETLQSHPWLKST